MNHFDAVVLCIQMGNLSVAEARFEHNYEDSFWGPHKPRVEFLSMIVHASLALEAAGLTEAVHLLNAMQKRISDGFQDNSALAAEARNAKAIIWRSLGTLKFLHVAADRIEYLDQKDLFGSLVTERFRSAANDITEAGNCLAAECPTASVFHLMRAAEFGMRALARDRRVEFADKPIDQKEWGQILPCLEAKVTEWRSGKVAASEWPDSVVREKQIQFYHEVIQELRSFNEAWRRHISHADTTAFYDRDVAVSIMKHVRVFMEKLATKISEDAVTDLIWQTA